MLQKRIPLSKELTHLSRLYYGVVTRKLSALEIERYYYILILIKEGKGKITPKELACGINSDKVFIVKILDYLYDKGMINRAVNAEDRRQYFISLTEKGNKTVPLIAKAFKEATEEVFKGIKKEEREIYYKVNDAMKKNLESLPSDEMKVNFKRVKKQKNKYE
ncbi:MAG TPA: MarR family transcriptional regulator [Cytophagaceae bacterium]|jgi:DNA-binding MarR family transcriptional regulator|nr:MarR family transcriptional regulator [Cytophagaceae bacterium]